MKLFKNFIFFTIITTLFITGFSKEVYSYSEDPPVDTILVDLERH